MCSNIWQMKLWNVIRLERAKILEGIEVQFFPVAEK